jgi:hypothetical protein
MVSLIASILPALFLLFAMNNVQIVSLILAIVVVIIIMMRRRSKSVKKV